MAKLPSSLTRRRAQIDATLAAPPENAQPPAQAAAPEAVAEPVVPTSEGTQVVSPVTAEELRLLREEVTELRRTAAAPPPPVATPEPPEQDFDVPFETRDVTPAEREQYKAADNFVRGVVEETAARLIQPLIAEINALRKQIKAVNGTADVLVKTTFQDSLRQAIPDFPAIIKEEGFLVFARQESPTGRDGSTMQQELKLAYDAKDVARVAKIMRLYKPAAVTPSVSAAQAPASPAPAAGLTALRQPTPQGGRAAPTASAEKPKFSKSQRDADFTAFRQGKLTPADWKAKQAMYTAADVEGRFDHAS